MSSQKPFANFNVPELVSRFVELQAAVDRYLHAGEYELAAEARDEREALKEKVRALGNETLCRNIKILAGRRSEFPVIDLLDAKVAVAFDEPLLHKLELAPVPVRWVVRNCGMPAIGSLRQRLASESVVSAHFQARFPQLSSASLSQAKYVHQWIAQLAHETDMSATAVVWICLDLDWLARKDALDPVLNYLEDPNHEFIVFATLFEELLAQRFTQLLRVTEIQA